VSDATQDLEYAASLTADEVSNLLAEVDRLTTQHEADVSRLMLAGHTVGRLTAERDRLRGGIEAHRYAIKMRAWEYPPMRKPRPIPLTADLDLHALLDRRNRHE